MALNDINLIPTKASLSKDSELLREFKCTIFKSYKSKQTSLSHKKVNKSDDGNRNILDLKRAKHEVFRFGTSGLETKDKEVAKIALAVRLGAKPPKNKYKNYKDLLAEKKELKEKQHLRDQLQTIGKNAQRRAEVTYKQMKISNKKRKLNAPISQHYGVVNPKIIKGKKK